MVTPGTFIHHRFPFQKQRRCVRSEKTTNVDFHIPLTQQPEKPSFWISYAKSKNQLSLNPTPTHLPGPPIDRAISPKA